MLRKLTSLCAKPSRSPALLARKFTSLTCKSRAIQPKANQSALKNAFLRFSPTQQQVRHLNIHEYQAQQLLAKYGVNVPKSKVVSTPAEAETAAEDLPGPDFVVKAQILAGGRGKGKFSNGFEGGVHICNSVLEARSLAAKMIGQRLITKQTGPEGKPVSKVLITERLFLRRETYFAILMDRQSEGPVLVASPKGGMDIEAVAASTPELIFKEPINMQEGVNDAQVERLARAMGFNTPYTIKQTGIIIKKLYEVFLKHDCTLVEINPMGETHNGQVLCVDSKLNFDDNAEFRQKDIFALRDVTQEDPRETDASAHGLNYIGLDGDIGCLVNGAGLAMATLDVIKLYGGNPANFLDLGGGASASQVTEAFRLLNSDKHVRAILVNIFGGIMRCDVIALGLLKAVTSLGIKKPLVVRLDGTNQKEARKLIEESGMRMVFAEDLGEAAQKVVRVVDIIKMAEQADLSVSFELPL